MINKQKNTEKAALIKEFAEKYGVTELVGEMDEFMVHNNEYKAHILMIGGYSAGKSALLNKYIGKNVLRENQGPETDIATELHFSENERLIAIMLNGTKEEVSSIEEVDVDAARNVEYYLDSENIKTQCDYIMVDTPGFDSGIEKHNKALMRYVGRGTAFFLVVDCEKGTLSESTLKFVNEATNYSTDIAVIINKCDKKIPEEIQEVKEHIEDLLLASSGRAFPIICTSIYDDDVDIKIKKLIEGFDPQYLYDKNVTTVLEKKCIALIDALELIKASATCDTSEIEEEIANREKAKKRLLEQINLQKKRLGTKLHVEVKERIVSNVQSQLMCNAGILADAYKGGIELFQERVVEIIRPIIISEVKDYSSDAYENFLKHLNYSSLNDTDSMEKLGAVIESVYEKLKNLDNEGGLLVPSDYALDNEQAVDGGIRIYRAVSSILAIATNAIAPPLELLIVFLPDIIKLLNTLTGNTKEQRLIEAIQNKIIPQIISQLRKELDKSLTEVETVMIDNISINIEEILNIENNALETALNKKKEAEVNYSEFIDAIDKDIEMIRK